MMNHVSGIKLKEFAFEGVNFKLVEATLKEEVLEEGVNNLRLEVPFLERNLEEAKHRQVNQIVSLIHFIQWSSLVASNLITFMEEPLQVWVTKKIMHS